MLGKKIGAQLKGGEVIELISDLGGGKTTFVKGLAEGFGSSDPVSSPSFTVNYVYGRDDGKVMYHFDFYRLNDAGIVGNELQEVEGDQDVVTVVEWGDIVHNMLPENKITIEVKAVSDTRRQLIATYNDNQAYLFP